MGKITGVVLGTMAVMAMVQDSGAHKPLSEQSLKAHVVKLMGNGAVCSGEQVKAPSGRNFILSAGHCANLADAAGDVVVIKEDGHELKRHVIAEDMNADLLLIEGLDGMEGLRIAPDVEMGQDIRTFTHGHDMPTFKTEGVLIGEHVVKIPKALIESPEDAAKCVGAKYAIEEIPGPIPGLEQKVCVLSMLEIATTALIMPGSSGGEVVDANGDLVGVVSACDDKLGFLVPLRDIKAFMKGR